MPPSVAVEGLEEALADGFGDRAVFVDGAGLDAHDEALEDLHNRTLVSAATTFRAHGGRDQRRQDVADGLGKIWSTKQLLRTGGRLLTKR